MKEGDGSSDQVSWARESLIWGCRGIWGRFGIRIKYVRMKVKTFPLPFAAAAGNARTSSRRIHRGSWRHALPLAVPRLPSMTSCPSALRLVRCARHAC